MGWHAHVRVGMMERMEHESPSNALDGQSIPRKRLRHYDTAGHARFLTFSCYRDRPLLASSEQRDWTVQAIGRARAKHCFQLWAYVVMPTHVHVLIRPNHERPDVSGILSSIKQSVAKRAVRKAKVEHQLRSLMAASDNNATLRFWQRGGGYDRNLWSTIHVWAAIDYIHSNPVKAGYCVSSMDWRWSSAAEANRPGAGPLSLEMTTIPPVQR